MRVTICDKCGEILRSEQKITNVRIDAWYRRKDGMCIDIQSDACDYTQLCPECFKEFLTFVTTEFPFETTGHEDDDREEVTTDE